MQPEGDGMTEPDMERVTAALRLLAAGGRGVIHGVERMVRGLEMAEDAGGPDVRAAVKTLSEHVGEIRALVALTEATLKDGDA